MIFTEEEIKSGYAAYCEAKQFLAEMEAALKRDGILESSTPPNVQREIARCKKTVTEYEKRHR